MHHICRCLVYYEIRGRFHCLFRDGFGPLTKVMNYTDQRCLGLFLLELGRHRESLLRDQTRRIIHKRRSPISSDYRRSSQTTKTRSKLPLSPISLEVSRSTGLLSLEDLDAHKSRNRPNISGRFIIRFEQFRHNTGKSQ